FCSEEAKAMGHCGNEPRAGSGDRILSLRQPIQKGGKPYWSPHLTFVIDERGFLGEMKGRGNDKPVPKYYPYIITLLKDNRVKGTKGASWYKEHNFKMSDLTEEQRQEIYAANAAFKDPKSMLGGKTPEAIQVIAKALGLDEDYYKPEWEQFVVNGWDNIQACMASIGNGLAESAARFAMENKHHPTSEYE